MSKKIRGRRQQKSKTESQHRSRTLTLVVIILIIIAIFWSNLNRPAEPLAGDLTLALGASIYSENCASCHGSNGDGHAEVAAAPALNDREHAWHHADGQLQQIVLMGGPTMPSFQEKLTNDEVIAVIRYFQTWWTASQLQSQQSLSGQVPFTE